MLINEVCKACDVTRKAVAYYVEQGLLAPETGENGYRFFSEEDAERLKRISVLRTLGLSVEEIRLALSANTTAALNEAAARGRLRMELMREKSQLLQELADTADWEHVREQLRPLEQRQSVLTRLLDVFPGYFGQFFCAHFAPFLKEPAETADQRAAYAEVVDFLDHARFEVPEDARELLAEMSRETDASFAENVSAAVAHALEDMDAYMAENGEAIRQYMALKKSEEYRQSAACHLECALREFGEESGYNEVFLPAMRRLSTSYAEYWEALQKANEKFLRRFPQE